MLNDEASLDEIIEIVEIHRLKIKNVYIFGSRLSGYNRPTSDFDIKMIASTMDLHKEIKNEKYNIHIVTSDKFRDDLNRYVITNLECIWSPNWAKLQEKEKIMFEIIPDRLKKYFLAQSHDFWHKAKMKFNEGDIERGVKSAFHALKILLNGIDILKNNKITDFGIANELYKKINNEDFYEWYQVKDVYFAYKLELENQLKNL